MSIKKSDKSFLEGIRYLSSKEYREAEKKLREALLKKSNKYEKAELIYQALLIRKECGRLLQELKEKF